MCHVRAWDILATWVNSEYEPNPKIMGESFQDYSWIQNFEADFPQKVSLKMMN